MSFVQRLEQKTFEVHSACRDQWVQETLAKLMMQCEAVAAQGGCQVHLTEPGPLLAREAAMTLMDQKLAELGFTQKQVGPQQSLFGAPQNQPQALAFGQRPQATPQKVSIQVWWNMTPQEPESIDTAARGLRGNCAICHENRHMVALVPCGHTMCKQCHQSSQLRQCPMCRKNLLGATEALFLD